MCDLSRVSVVVPSLDPDEKLSTVISGLLEHGFRDIVLVNDGSRAETLPFFEAAAAHPEVHLLQHGVNKGKGAALKTAFQWILENRPDCTGVVTVDGDNQHRPEDTRNCAEQMLQTGRLILGVRDFSLPQVPPKSRMGNRITCGVFRLFCGLRFSDTQTGLRAIPKKYLEIMTQIGGDRYEYETNMLLCLKDYSIPWEEVKIQTVYIEENSSSHFRAVRDSWRIYKLILAHFFRYILSSFLSFLTDEGVFAVTTALTNNILTGFWLTAVPAVCARVCSSLLNFFLNQKMVFKSKSRTGRAMVRYYALAVLMLVLQLSLTYGICLLFHIGAGYVGLRSVVYGLVMASLFLVSYNLQRRWVFAESTDNANEEITL